MDDRKQVTAAIRDYLARERMSREQFAFKTKLGKSTVDKLLTGLYSDRTLVIVESPHRPAAARGAGRIAAPRRSPEPPRVSDKPSIAVMPFVNMSGDPEHEFLADGLTEDIITALARLGWLFVIARNSTFVYKNKPTDVRAVARDLGVRYVLEGSVRMSDRRLRITGQLIEAETGKHVWADRYDRVLEDLFAVQDDITERVVGGGRAASLCRGGVSRRAPSDRPDRRLGPGGARAQPDQQGRPARQRGGARAPEQRDRARARLCARPRAARLGQMVGRALLLVRASPRGLPANRPRTRRTRWRSIRSTRGRAWCWGWLFRRVGQHDRALGELRVALNLNPSFALGHMAHGWALLRAGQFDRGDRRDAARRCGSRRSTVSPASMRRSTGSPCSAPSASTRRCRSCALRLRPSRNIPATTTR